MSEEIVKRGEPNPVIVKRIPGLLEFVALDDIQVELRKLNDHFKKDEFEGLLDPRTLQVTGQYQVLRLSSESPPRRWITASAHNYGPNTANLSINNSEWIPLRANEDYRFDFKGSDERIEVIGYQCDTGNTALVQINGKY